MANLKRISQETFDSVVEENVNDFEMMPAEALADAIKQFQSQGVNLSNIDTTGGIGRAELLGAIDRVKLGEIETLASSLSDLEALCTENCEYMTRNLNFVNSHGCVEAVSKLLALPNEQRTIKQLALKVLITFCRNHGKFTSFDKQNCFFLGYLNRIQFIVDNRDYFEPGGCGRLVNLLVEDLKNIKSINESYDLITVGLELVRAVCKAEHNKGTI